MSYHYLLIEQWIGNEQANISSHFQHCIDTMVISIGCFYQYGEFQWFNSKTNEINFFNVQIDSEHIKLFQGLQGNIKEPIDSLCVYMGYKYTNNERKEFYKCAKTQNYIKNVKIISYYQAFLLTAIEILSFTPVKNDSIWTVINNKDSIECIIWNYSEKKEWQFGGRFNQDKTLREEDEPPTFNDLKELKFKINATPRDSSRDPYIYIYSNCIIDTEEFREVFSCYKNILTNSIWSISTAALNYAKSLSNVTGYLKYRFQSFLDKLIILMHNNVEVIRINYFTAVPFTRLVHLEVKKGDILEIFEREICATTIVVESSVEFDLMFNVDVNGIYTLHAKNVIVFENFQAQNDFYFVPKQMSSYDTNVNAIGIDFGTTECCASVMRKKGVDFVVLDSVTGFRTMPSYVAFDEKKAKCGQIVIDRMKHKAEYSVFDIKRIMGKDYENITVDSLWPFKIIRNGYEILIEVETFIGKKKLTSESISAVLLNHIKTVAESYQNAKMTDAVIAIPSKFTDQQKYSLKTAAEFAGWTNIYFLPEAVAAAFAYFMESDILQHSHILICDCGGGTVDICVAKILKDYLHVLSFDGDPYLGGRDFDNILFTHFNGVLKHKFGIDVTKNRKKYLLSKKCQEIKHMLSTAEEDWLDVEDYDNTIDEIIRITKTEFEEMSLPLMVKIKNVILRALEDSKVPKNAINYVFQVGGGCRMPMIKTLLADIFPDSSHQCSLYPDWVVAHGAALYAYQLHMLKNGTIVNHPFLAWLTKHFVLEPDFIERF